MGEDFSSSLIIFRISSIILLDAIRPFDSDGYSGSAPDIGAFEFSPALTLRASPADRVIRLTWTVNASVPVSATWRISYQGRGGGQPSPISGIPAGSRAYTLTGLTNYTLYTITLNGMLEGSAFLTDTVQAMPSDIFVYLPLILK